MRRNTTRTPTTIQTARQAAKAAGVRLYSKAGLALAVGLLRQGAEGARAKPLPPRPIMVTVPRGKGATASEFSPNAKNDR